MTDEQTTDRAVEQAQVTPAAAEMLRSLIDRHGPLMFHQSGGCCDGSAPMCYPQGEFKVGSRDVHLGDLEVGDDVPAVPVYISGEQWQVWKHTKLTIDLVPGRGSGFSVESPTGYRFLTRSDVCAT